MNFVKRLFNKKNILFIKFIQGVSFIFTINNGESYLKPIINPIQRQNLFCIEIIINVIAQKIIILIKKKDLKKNGPIIKNLINKENKGQIDAIIREIFNVKGEYNFFFLYINLIISLILTIGKYSYKKPYNKNKTFIKAIDTVIIILLLINMKI